MTSFPRTLPPSRPEVSGRPSPETEPRWIEISRSADHKTISLVLISIAFGSLFLAGFETLLMRLQLAVPENAFLNAITFDRLLSLYGMTAVFLVALPICLGLLYYVVPLQIGSRGTALPRVGQTGMWFFILGGVTLYATLVFTPPEAGINPLPPLSEFAFTPNNGVDAWITATALSGLGLLMIAVDLATTLHNLRAPGMYWRRAPLFTFAGAVVSWLLIVVTPILLAALTMLMIDRHYGGSFFSGDSGGSPILWQHFSYIFFTASYMVVAVTFLAAIAEIVQTFTQRELVARKVIIRSLAAIAIIGTLAWTQNMMTAPIPSGFRYFSMLLSISLIVPFGLIFYNLISHVSASDFHMQAPLRFAMGALSLASIGLIAEVAQSAVGVATQLQHTYDAWAATHFALIGFVVFGGFAAVSYWYPKMTGFKLNEDRSKKSFQIMFVGILVALLPLFAAGIEGQVTDAYRYFIGTDFKVYNIISAVGTVILFIGIILAIGNLIKSRIEEPASPPDPYRGSSLEWLTLSPPPSHNFDVLPDVRSTQPMRDIRDALARHDPEAHAPAGEHQPVA